MRILTSIVILLALNTQALALSCEKPDIVRSYVDHAEAQETYVVVKGKFRFAPPPKQPVSGNAKPQTVRANFEGVALSAGAFDTAYTRPLTISMDCAGLWCGTVEPDVETLAFIELNGKNLHLIEGPCPWRVFRDPTSEQVERLLACHTRGDCK